MNKKQKYKKKKLETIEEEGIWDDEEDWVEDINLENKENKENKEENKIDVDPPKVENEINIEENKVEINVEPPKDEDLRV